MTSWLWFYCGFLLGLVVGVFVVFISWQINDAALREEISRD